jgi:fatty acid desaturase
MTRHQGALLPVLYLLWAFAMKWDGLTYVWRNRARVKLDAAVLVAHVVFWLVVPAILAGPGAALLGYAVWNVVAGLYLALIIPVNHVGLQPIPPGEHVDFVTQQIRGSRNLVGPGWFYDFFFIGLNRQIEHHLFPFVATPRLARGAAVVKAFCAEHGLPYGEERYLAAMAGVHAHLWRVGKRLGEPDAEPAEAPAAAIDG